MKVPTTKTSIRVKNIYLGLVVKMRHNPRAPGKHYDDKKTKWCLKDIRLCHHRITSVMHVRFRLFAISMRIPQFVELQ